MKHIGSCFCRNVLMLAYGSLLALPILGSVSAMAQDTSRVNDSRPGFVDRNVKLSGSLGTYGELYNMSGAENRRPGSTGRIYFKPTLTLYNSLTLSADFLISNESNSNRQNINQFDLNPKWGWGNAHLGDFTENYSSLTLSGIRIRGGGISMNPGKFRFSTIYGQSRRATLNSSTTRSYSRQIYGGRIGLGRKSGSNVDLIFLKLKDKASSLPSLTDSTSGQDSTHSDSTANPWANYPEENMVMAIASNLEMFKRKLSWKNELAGSVFTRNVEGDKLEDIPSWVNSIFKFRIGSRVDLAYKTEINYEAKRWNMASGYEFIGPGYSSLGLSSLSPDRQQFHLGGYLKGKKWSIGIRGSLENDNLIDQKTYTTVHKRLNGSINYRPIRWWNVIMTGNLVNISNDAQNDTVMVGNSIAMMGLNQVFSLSNSGLFQNASINYISQTTSDDNPFHDNTDLRSHSLDLRITAKPAASFTIIPSMMLIKNRVGNGGWGTTSNYQLNIQYITLAQKLTANLGLGPSFSGNTKSFKFSTAILYKITPMDYIQTDFRYSHFKGIAASSNFDEYVGSLSLSHRF
jgi:hypothetical protein